MELRDALEYRASVRTFTDEKVPVEDLRELARRAGLAPSVNNSQPWKFIAVTNRKLLDAMAEAVVDAIEALFPDEQTGINSRAKTQVEHFSTVFRRAPACIVVVSGSYEALSDKLTAKGDVSHDDLNAMRQYPDMQSIGAAIQNLLLSAVDLGYGACWLSGLLVARERIERLLGLEEGWALAAAVAVGKASGPLAPREKNPVEEVFAVIG